MPCPSSARSRRKQSEPPRETLAMEIPCMHIAKQMNISASCSIYNPTHSAFIHKPEWKNPALPPEANLDQFDHVEDQTSFRGTGSAPSETAVALSSAVLLALGPRPDTAKHRNNKGKLAEASKPSCVFDGRVTCSTGSDMSSKILLGLVGLLFIPRSRGVEEYHLLHIRII